MADFRQTAADLAGDTTDQDQRIAEALAEAYDQGRGESEEELANLRAQLAELTELGVSIHKRVAQERAAIVAWLQSSAVHSSPWSLSGLVEAIERGEHHEEE